MLRRRRLAFPTVYRQNAVVMSNHFSQVVLSRLERFKKKDKTVWDDVFGMLTGIEEQFFGTLNRSTRSIFVPKPQFSPLVRHRGIHFKLVFYNLWLRHHCGKWQGPRWTYEAMVSPIPCVVIVQPALQGPDRVAASRNGQEEALVHMASPTGSWDDSDKEKVNPDSVISWALWALFFNIYIDVVVFCCSGDCGMYAIKYVEHLLAGLKLDTINDDNT